MANFESKTIKVDPFSEDKIIEVYEIFGWTLEDSQELYNKHTDIGDTVIWGEVGFTEKKTETTHFVRLRFRRDKEMFNYSKIKELEAKYWENYRLYISTPGLIPGLLISGWTLIFGISALLGFISCFATGSFDPFLGAFFMLILALIPFSIRTVLYYLPKKKKGDKGFSRCLEIENEVKELRKS